MVDLDMDPNVQAAAKRAKVLSQAIEEGVRTSLPAGIQVRVEEDLNGEPTLLVGPNWPQAIKVQVGAYYRARNGQKSSAPTVGVYVDMPQGSGFPSAEMRDPKVAQVVGRVVRAAERLFGAPQRVAARKLAAVGLTKAQADWLAFLVEGVDTHGANHGNITNEAIRDVLADKGLIEIQTKGTAFGRGYTESHWPTEAGRAWIAAKRQRDAVLPQRDLQVLTSFAAAGKTWTITMTEDYMAAAIRLEKRKLVRFERRPGNQGSDVVVTEAGRAQLGTT